MNSVRITTLKTNTHKCQKCNHLKRFNSLLHPHHLKLNLKCASVGGCKQSSAAGSCLSRTATILARTLTASDGEGSADVLRQTDGEERCSDFPARLSSYCQYITVTHTRTYSLKCINMNLFLSTWPLFRMAMLLHEDKRWLTYLHSHPYAACLQYTGTMSCRCSVCWSTAETSLCCL